MNMKYYVMPIKERLGRSPNKEQAAKITFNMF